MIELLKLQQFGLSVLKENNILHIHNRKLD